MKTKLMSGQKKVLVVAAHPDDEILGCGGTMARLTAEGHKVYTMILGEGITSRDDRRDAEKHSGEIRELKEHIRRANAVVGVKDVQAFNLPDNRFDSVPLLDVIKVVEKAKSVIDPDVVFTHHRADLNIDHRVVYNAVLTACRPVKGEAVREIYSFEVPSSTGWNVPDEFRPVMSVDIAGTIGKKVRAMDKYTTEVRAFPHPRSSEGIRAFARYRGTLAGMAYAEAFEVVRVLR